MEKRLVIFVICSALILFGYQALMQTFFPPPPQAEQVAEQVDSPDEAGKDEAGKDEAGKSTPGKTRPSPRMPKWAPSRRRNGSRDRGGQSTANRSGRGHGGNTGSRGTGGANPVADRAAAVVMLGSYDATSPFQLMVTLTNRGAAVERVELVERRTNGKLRYRDLDSQTGYAGFHCRDTATGCVVSAVGPGYARRTGSGERQRGAARHSVGRT